MPIVERGRAQYAMAKPITYADLDRFLAQSGFAVERSGPATVVYSSPSTDVFFAFPRREPTREVDPFHLWSVRTMLVERGIVEEEDFEQWTCRVRFPDVCPELGPPLAVGGPVSHTR